MYFIIIIYMYFIIMIYMYFIIMMYMYLIVIMIYYDIFIVRNDKLNPLYMFNARFDLQPKRSLGIQSIHYDQPYIIFYIMTV